MQTGRSKAGRSATGAIVSPGGGAGCALAALAESGRRPPPGLGAAACPHCRAAVDAAGGEGAVVALAAAALAGLRLLHGGAARLDPGPAAERPTAVAATYAFRREGEYWTLACQGRVSRVRGLRGFDYLAELLRHPYRQLYVVDLAGLGHALEPGISVADALASGLRVGTTSATDATLDRRARDDYRTRWRDLVGEEAAAQRDNDLGRLAVIQREIGMLTGELAAAAGRTARSLPSPQERARVNVRNCISAALRSIQRHDETLWRHLANAIRTGIFCSYEPERPVDWEM